MLLLYIYIYIYIYTYTHRETDQQVHVPRTESCLRYGEMIATTTHETFAAHARPQRQVHVRYTHTHTHIYIYIYKYIYTHTQTQASKSMYHARPLVCSYVEMIAITTQETFAALAHPQRQVKIRYIHTHTHRDRPASPCTT
jgi:hypothetical protein